MASTATTSVQSPKRIGKALALGAILVVSVGFVLKYVFHYYLNYNPAGFEPYWGVRIWLIPHITFGMVALLTGPLQFSTRIRQRHLQFHRVLGRVYLVSVGLGSAASIGLALSDVGGWPFDYSLACMALVWSTCGAMAYYAVRRKQIQVHKEWMVRTYIVTFGFVLFRVLNDVGPTAHLKPVMERSDVFVWTSWVMPLVAAEVIMQLMRMGKPARSAS